MPPSVKPLCPAIFRKLSVNPGHCHFDGIELSVVNDLEVVTDPGEQLMPRSTFVVPGNIGHGTEPFKTSLRLPLSILRSHLTPSVIVDDLNLVGKHIQCKTVIPMNVYQVTTKVFEFVLDNPFRGNANRALVALDISHCTAFESF
ncbi:MAG TPA: hypothetical protein VGA09_01625 [Candidatus Binatia bacterium]